ncbi:MAG: hypothetical protein ACLR1V_14555 [Coprococcus sp.]
MIMPAMPFFEQTLASGSGRSRSVQWCDRKYCDRSGGHLCSPGYAKPPQLATECGKDRARSLPEMHRETSHMVDHLFGSAQMK